MKKIFTYPEVRIAKFCAENIITTSAALTGAYQAMTGSDGVKVKENNITVVDTVLRF